MKCPVCAKENNGTQCSYCSYDFTKDYSLNPTCVFIGNSHRLDMISRRKTAIDEVFRKVEREVTGKNASIISNETAESKPEVSQSPNTSEEKKMISIGKLPEGIVDERKYNLILNTLKLQNDEFAMVGYGNFDKLRESVLPQMTGAASDEQLLVACCVSQKGFAITDKALYTFDETANNKKLQNIVRYEKGDRNAVKSPSGDYLLRGESNSILLSEVEAIEELVDGRCMLTGYGGNVVIIPGVGRVSVGSFLHSECLPDFLRQLINKLYPDRRSEYFSRSRLDDIGRVLVDAWKEIQADKSMPFQIKNAIWTTEHNLSAVSRKMTKEIKPILANEKFIFAVDGLDIKAKYQHIFSPAEKGFYITSRAVYCPSTHERMALSRIDRIGVSGIDLKVFAKNGETMDLDFSDINQEEIINFAAHLDNHTKKVLNK